MRTKVLCLIATSSLLQPLVSVGQDDEGESLACWNDPHIAPIAYDGVRILKTLLLPIRLDEPILDAEVRVAHHDFRFIAVGGTESPYPGIDDKILLCQLGWRLIPGTFDGVQNDEHRELIKQFRDYAEAYNSRIVSVYVSMFASGSTSR